MVVLDDDEETESSVVTKVKREEEIEVLSVKKSPATTRAKRRRQSDDIVDLTSSHESHPPASLKRPRPVEEVAMSIHPPPESQAKLSSLKCSICLDVVSHPFSTICGHIYCEACIKLAVKQTGFCPTCRKKLTVKQLHRIYL